jgi:hypothetical protein
MGREAFQALKDEHSRRWLREEIFVPAILEAARSRRRPQYIRIGSRWITDAAGRKACLAPMKLSVRLFRRWLKTRAWAIAAKKLELGRPLAPLTEKERDAIRRAAKQGGVTPNAIRKQVARVQAKLHTFQKRSHARRRP